MQNMQMETVRVPAGLLPAIAEYLAQQPAVAMFLALQQVEPVKPVKPVDPEEPAE